MTHPRTAAEAQNRAQRLAELTTAFCRALDSGDTDAARRIGNDMALLAGMLADAWGRVESAPGGMSQAMRLMTSQQSDEWYTPAWIIELARTVMGGIDLDPASNATAQATVQATHYYTQDDDGFMKPWFGRVFLNPPFTDTARWARRLAAAYTDGDVSAGVLLVNSAPGYLWYEELCDQWAAVQLRKRVAFVRGDGSSAGLAKKSQTIFYFGTQPDHFFTTLAPYGRRLLTAPERSAPATLWEVAS